jgi:hypothetical protein
MRVQNDKSWKWGFAFRSYTSFVKTFSKDSGINESLLWRYLGAGKYYNKIRGNFDWPELALLPESVSPDSLEVLGKLERVLPEDDFKRLAMSIFNQTIKREELRNLWNMYRPVFKGETARGSYKKIPSVDKDNIKQLGLLQYSQFVNSLIENSMCFSSNNGSNYYRVFSKMNLPKDGEYLISLGIDVVVIGKDANTLDVKLHGIRYISEDDFKSFNEMVFLNLTIQAKYFDFLWLASREDLLTDKFEIPNYVGIILSRDVGNKVLRMPSTNEYSGMDINRILKDLLLM